MHGDSGCAQPKYRKQLCKLRMWKKLVTMDNQRTIKRIFENDFNVSKNNCCEDVKEIFENIGSPEVFL